LFHSLRFRLPALFLAGIVLAGLVSTAIAIRLFQSYERDQALRSWRREASGLAALYHDQALEVNEGRAGHPARFAPSKLEQATGDRIFYVGLSIFPGQTEGLHRLSRKVVGWKKIQQGHSVTFEFNGRGHERLLAVAHPLSFGQQTFGAFVVAKPTSELRARWLTLIRRLAIAFAFGILVAAALAWYLSRRITRPVLALSRAADEVAEGHYEVALPTVRARDEVGHLADRFREMATKLGEAEELERNFLMTVSHELRTPLTAIRGHVEALREGVVRDPAAQEKSLAVIATEADRLERLVDDVLDLAKLDSHRFTMLEEEVDMERLVDRAYAAFGEEARRRGIDYRRLVSSPKPVIVSDGDRVLQIISNLLSNAFRWTPDGGRIELALSREDGSVRVAVGDTGPGIDEEERDRIFRPFWSRDGGGTGLGLAIARELALALGGRIELETEPGQGSRFELVLPTR